MILTLQILNVILIGDHDGDLRISQDLIPDSEDRGAGSGTGDVENNSTTPEIKDYYSQLLGLSGDDSYEERCKLHTVCGMTAVSCTAGTDGFPL